MNSHTNKHGTPFDETCRFIIKFGTMVHGYGPRSSQLESYMSRITRSLGYYGDFAVTPRAIYSAFWQEGEIWQHSHLASVPGNAFDTAKLARASDLVNEIEAGKVSVLDGPRHLEEIDKGPDPWGHVPNAIAYGCAGMAFAAINSGSEWDVIVSGILSIVIYGMLLLSDRIGGSLAEWIPMTTAFVVGFLVMLLTLILPELSPLVVTISALIILIPGYTVSTGIFELTDHHVLSGLANLMNGLVYLLKQFAGAWLGVQLGILLWSFPDVTGSPVNPSLLWLAWPLLWVAACIIFQTLPRDFSWAFGCCAITYVGMSVGSAIAGNNLGTLIGAIVAGGYANLWSRKLDRPSTIMLIPALITLVGGSIGFRGLAAVSQGQSALGVQDFLNMFVIAIAIGAGIVVSNAIVRPETMFQK